MNQPFTYLRNFVLALSIAFFSFSAYAQRSLKAHIPDDLAQTRVLLLKYKFDELMSTVEGNLEEMDDHLRTSYYKEHLATLQAMEQLFTEQQVEYQVAPAGEYDRYASDFHYVVRYTLTCESADDWSWCGGGFYFTDLGKNLAFEAIGMDKKSFKALSRQIEHGTPALISVDSDPDE